MKNKAKTGACRFCGQIRQVELPEDLLPKEIEELTEDELDTLATEQCSCTEAKTENDRKTRYNTAMAAIDEYFNGILQTYAGEEDTCKQIQNQRELVLNATAVVFYKYAQAASIQLDEDTVFAIKLTGDGTLKLARTFKSKEVWEF